MTTILLIVHVITGYTALLAGFFAALSKKKRGLHSRSGNTFFYGMTVALIAAILLNLIKFSPFLFPIALFTLYMILGGKLVISIQNAHLLGKWWRVYTSFGLLISLLMIGIAVILLLKNLLVMSIILLVFGIIQSLMTFSDWKNNPGKNPKSRIFQHINKMGGGMIAAITAFAAVNIQLLPPLVVWLTPSLIGSFLIAYAIRQRRKSLQIKS